MRISRSRPGTMGIAALALGSLVLTACGSSGGGTTPNPPGGSTTPGSSQSSQAKGATSGNTDTTGISATEIKLGTHQPLTGVAAPGYSNIAPGAKAYYDYVNDAGGVNGRKITLNIKDDTYNPTTTGQVVDELTLQDKVFAIAHGLGTPTHTAVIDQLNESKIPDLFVSSGALAWNQPKKYPYTFGWQPNYEIEGKIIGDYIKKNMPKAKVGLYLQGDDLGRDGAKGLKQFIAGQIVSEQEYTSGNTNVAPQIGALQAAGADLIVGFNVPAYTALAVLTAQKLQYKPQYMFSSVAFDPQLVSGLLANFSKGAVTAQAGAGLLDGVSVTSYLPTVDQTDNPWIQLFNKVWKAKGDGKPLTNFGVYGMSEAYTVVQSIQAAGKDINRGNIISAIEQNGASFKGPWEAPFAYSADNHSGISGVGISQFKGGKIVQLEPVMVTGNGDTPITPAKVDPATPPASGIPE